MVPFCRGVLEVGWSDVDPDLRLFSSFLVGWARSSDLCNAPQVTELLTKDFTAASGPTIYDLNS